MSDQPLPISRRAVIRLAAISATAAAIAPDIALAQRKPAVTEVPVDELMKPGPLPDLVIGKADAPVTDRRVRLDDLRPLRQLPQHGASRRSRRSTSTPARCASSCASSRSTTSRRPPRCWRAAPAASKTFAAHRRAVQAAGRLGVRAGQSGAGAVQDRQAGRLHPGELRQVPDRPEAARRRSRPMRDARRREVRRQLDADLLHQRQAARPARRRSRTSTRRSSRC